jgi:TonB-dependent SusC/RagA subfamily outer membrane receptor
MKWNYVFIFTAAISLSQISIAQVTDKVSNKPITITGKVLTLDQKPVAGAVIYVDNSKTSFVTSSKGSYKIKVSPSARKLAIHSSEYGNCDTLINQQTTINFTFQVSSKLQKDDKDITRKGDYENTGNGSVKMDNESSRYNKIEGDLNKNSQYQNIYDMLNGTVPGVIVNGKKITIRGQSSFYGTNEPLFVVDGVIVTSIDDIRPIEVKSIQVVKSSSAAIYGSRGSNGVIVITRIQASDHK